MLRTVLDTVTNVTMNYPNIHIRDVYYFFSRLLGGETKSPHYHIVIATGEFLHNGNPGAVVAILYSYKPERYRKLLRLGREEENIVILEEDEYEHLTQKTMVDCDSVHIIGMDEIDTTTKRVSVSPAVHTKILESVLKSKYISMPVRRACRNARGR